MFQLPEGYRGLEDKVAKEFVFDPQGRWRAPAIVSSPLCRPTTVVKQVTICDDTLREGLNTPGVYPTVEGKLRIARALEDAGVTAIEGGYPEIDEHAELVRRLKASGSKLVVSMVVVNGHGDFRPQVDAAAAAGADHVRIFANNISYALNPTANLEAGLEEMQESVLHARRRGLVVSVAPLGGASLDMVRRVVTNAVACGASRVYVNDSQGAFTPEAAAFLVRFYRELVGTDVEVAYHGHDDYGFASVNAVQAAVAGADVVDVTVNRMCHRSGLSDFSQVVLALETLYGIETGVNLEKIYSVCKLVEEELRIPIPPNAPHIGEWAYCHSGVHPDIGRRGWWVFENIKPEAIGQHRTVLWTPTVLGRGGTQSALAHKITTMGYALDEDRLGAISGRLREVFGAKKYATTEEVESIIREVYAETACPSDSAAAGGSLQSGHGGGRIAGGG